MRRAPSWPLKVARFETQRLLRALAAQVERIETEEPVPFLNNVLQGYKSLPTTFH